jgi:hypothetical protein
MRPRAAVSPVGNERTAGRRAVRGHARPEHFEGGRRKKELRSAIHGDLPAQRARTPNASPVAGRATEGVSGGGPGGRRLRVRHEGRYAGGGSGSIAFGVSVPARRHRQRRAPCVGSLGFSGLPCLERDCGAFGSSPSCRTASTCAACRASSSTTTTPTKARSPRSASWRRCSRPAAEKNRRARSPSPPVASRAVRPRESRPEWRPRPLRVFRWPAPSGNAAARRCPPARRRCSRGGAPRSRRTPSRRSARPGGGPRRRARARRQEQDARCPSASAPWRHSTWRDC